MLKPSMIVFFLLYMKYLRRKRIWLLLVAEYCDLARTEEILFDYSKSIEINPQFADAYYNRGSFKI